MDFFAGSGTVGESCLLNRREFILVDNNKEALEVMAKRFSGINNIEWINFNPVPYQKEISPLVKELKNQPKDEEDISYPNIASDFLMLASTASYLQKGLEEMNDLWKDSPFEWVLQLPPRSKGKLARSLLLSFFATKGLSIAPVKHSSETLIINGLQFAIKFSMLWKTGIYKFQQIKSKGPENIICFGISPFEAHCWIFSRDYAIMHGKKQHQGANEAEYWLSINPKEIPDWARHYGGSLDEAFAIIKAGKIPHIS